MHKQQISLSPIPTPNGTDTKTHKKRKKRLLYAAALNVLWMLSPTPTVVNDLSRLLLHTAHTEMPCARSMVTLSKISPRDATSYGYTHKTQYNTMSVQRMQGRHTIKHSDCWRDCCYLTSASCYSVNLLPADMCHAVDTWMATSSLGRSQFKQH